MLFWRISNFADLSGIGGTVAAARWNRVNTPIVYCAEHPAAAVLEMLVHTDFEDAPETYQLLRIEGPDDLAVHEPALPANWAGELQLTQDLGSEFIASGKAPAMRVPSVVVPFTANYVLNPKLISRAGIRISAVTRHPVDKRLVGLR